MRCLAVLLFALVSLPAFAADLVRVSVEPASIRIVGSDDAPQLVVTGENALGKLLDLSGDATYTPDHPKLLRVTSAGRIIPLADGSTTIRVVAGGRTSDVAVTLKSVGENLPINFATHVVPIFTRLGCNAGGCHGKLSGQNGFRLSLLGFEPELDYATLVKEGRGRRMFPASPDASLLLRKASGSIAHGGGRKMEANSEEYRVVRRWIASGMPWGQPSDPTVTKIRIHPEARVLDRQSRQQLAVHAHYSDGSVEDITRRTQYDSNEPELATIDGAGVVRTLSQTGQAAVMARYAGHVAVFRATVPRPGKAPEYAFEPTGYVDRLVQARWKELNIAPSGACSDEQFIRRVSLDIAGTLPTPKQILDFVADTGAKKRDALVDRLLESPEYAYYFAGRWADILRVKRGNSQQRAYGTHAFHDWIVTAIREDRPYDTFATQVVTALGDEQHNPPSVWYKDILTPDQFVDNLSQVFLGVRMACANCHHHPFEKWSQDDYWGLAAYFARVDRKNLVVPGVQAQNQQGSRAAILVKRVGSVQNKRTGKPTLAQPLDGEAVGFRPDADPREHLAEWLTSETNPFFAKSVANRYWAHFMGRGIVDPIDDFRITNPPSNPALLDALADDLVRNRYSLKHLIRTICTSRAYQLDSSPSEFNKEDKQAYARYYPRRLSAEVLFDALNHATDGPANFTGLPKDRFAPTRAIMLPDEQFPSYFLDVFGRPQRISSCECERVSEASLAQILHMLNSDEVQGKVARPGGRADRMFKDARSDDDKLDELFLWTLGRKPSDTQRKTALENLARHEKNKKIAWENILWAVVNSRGFLFNQ